MQGSCPFLSRPWDGVRRDLHPKRTRALVGQGYRLPKKADESRKLGNRVEGKQHQQDQNSRCGHPEKDVDQQDRPKLRSGVPSVAPAFLLSLHHTKHIRVVASLVGNGLFAQFGKVPWKPPHDSNASPHCGQYQNRSTEHTVAEHSRSPGMSTSMTENRGYDSESRPRYARFVT